MVLQLQVSFLCFYCVEFHENYSYYITEIRNLRIILIEITNLKFCLRGSLFLSYREPLGKRQIFSYRSLGILDRLKHAILLFLSYRVRYICFNKQKLTPSNKSYGTSLLLHVLCIIFPYQIFTQPFSSLFTII